MLSFYFNLFIILFLSYIISEVLKIFTNLLPLSVKNRLFFLYMKIFDDITILDVISFMTGLLIILLNFKIILPHNSNF
jgi:hypothetical protein